MKCSICGAENSENAIFCKRCGNEIGAGICPGCGREVDSEKETYCKYCGTKLKTTGKYYDEPTIPVDEPNVIDVFVDDKPKTYSYSESSLKSEPGKNAAIAALVLGIISLVFWFMGALAILSTLLGVIGLVLSVKAKNEGYVSGVRTAGYVCSLIAVIGGALMFVISLAAAGAVMSIFGFI